MKIYKKNSFPRIINYEYNVIKKNHLHKIDDLFKANEEKNITIKIIGKKIYYLKNHIAHLIKNFFITL